MTQDEQHISIAALDLTHVQWRKSARSGEGSCVEVAPVKDVIAVRDSKDREGPVLFFTRSEWDAFIGGAKDGEFDLT